MSAITNAFSSGSGHSAGAISSVITLAVGALLVTLVAHLVLALWEHHQAGGIEAGHAGGHAVRLMVVLGMVLILLVAH